MAWQVKWASHLGVRAGDGPLFQHLAGTKDPAELIRFAAEHGFKGIEDNTYKSRPKEQQEAIAQALQRHGLAMGCMLATDKSIGTTLWGQSTPAARETLDAEFAATLEAAKRSGGRFLTTAGAADPRVPLGVQRIAMVEHLKRLGNKAARVGLVICVEQISVLRMPGMILHHIDEALQVVAAVNSPAVQLVFDIFHVHTMDSSLIANIERCHDRIAIVQASDSPFRFEPGSGEINFPNVLRALRRVGYDGLVELECFPETDDAAGERRLLERLDAIDAAL
jgi:hydroxypyruvate isomerase